MCVVGRGHILEVPSEQLQLRNAFYLMSSFRRVGKLRVSEQVAKLTQMFNSPELKIILEASFS